jgi:hypothetical protein
VVSDDGRELRLTLYGEAGIPAVAVVLDPARAVALAGDLIASASRRRRQDRAMDRLPVYIIIVILLIIAAVAVALLWR